MYPVISDQIWICRMCARLAQAVGNGKTDCGISNCGSPRSNHTFESYSGPLLGNLDKYCYACGADAEGSVCKDGSHIKIGICAKCAEILYTNG